MGRKKKEESEKKTRKRLINFSPLEDRELQKLCELTGETNESRAIRNAVSFQLSSIIRLDG